MGHISPVAARPGSRIAALIVAVLGVFALVVPIVGAANLTLPKGVTEDHALRMYTEQLDSAVALDQLVSGEMKALEVTGSRVTTAEAVLDVEVTYHSGVSRAGKLRMVRAGGKWYFASITRAGRVETGSELVTDPDVGVLNTMLLEQSTHATMTAGLVDGTYKKVDIGTPQDGYRSVAIPVTYSGKKTKKGEVTCVMRSEAGRDQWFVVSFSEK